MGRNTYAKDIRVSVGGQGQRKTYYGKNLIQFDCSGVPNR